MRGRIPRYRFDKRKQNKECTALKVQKYKQTTKYDEKLKEKRK